MPSCMMLLTKYSGAGFVLAGIALTFLNPVASDLNPRSRPYQN